MSESKKLNWGILSTANIARQAVVPALRKSKNGRVYALASRTLDGAAAMAADFGIGVTYGDYQALVDDPAVEAIYNPLPNHLHLEWSVKAMQAGKHVLCEKPLARNEAEAREMAAVQQASGVLLMEACMYRFHPRSQKVKQLIDDGAIGDVKSVKGIFTFKHPDPSDHRFTPEFGGGALLDVGFYGVNVARWMMGDEPVEVQASVTYGPSGIDLTTIGILRFPGERLAVIEASFDMALQQTFSIAGSKGVIELPHNAFVPGQRRASFTTRGLDDEKGQVQKVRGADEYQLMVEHFSGAALGEHELAFPPEDSILNMRALDALALAAREKRLVEVAP